VRVNRLLKSYPMKKIYLQMLRELWNIKWRSLTIALSISYAVGVYAGVDMAVQSLFATRDILYARMNFADLEVLFLPEDVNNLPDLGDIDGIAKVERRLIFPGTILLGEQKKILGVVVFLEDIRPEIDSLEMTAGVPLRQNDLQSAVIEQSLAHYHGLKLGDSVRVKVGEKIYESTIDGIAISPEYLTISANPDYFIPEKGTLGVVFGNLKRVDEALGFTMVNDLIFTFRKGADEAALKTAIVNRLSKLKIEKVISGKEHFSYRFLQMDLDALANYVPAFVIILVGLSFLTALLTFNRMVHQQKKQIGTLFAIGYPRHAALRAYLLGGLCLGLLGCVMGVGLSFAVRNAFSLTYAHALGLAICYNFIFFPSLLKGILLGLAVILIASSLPSLKYLRHSPQELIRGKIGGDIVVGGLLRRLFRRMVFLPIGYRFGLRNLFRRKWMTLSTVACLALSIGVAISYMISITSINRTVEETFTSENWDMAVDFLYPVFEEDLSEIGSIQGVLEVEPYLRGFVEIGKKRAGTDAVSTFENSSLLGVQPETRMKSIRLVAGSGFRPTGGPQIIVSQDLSDKLHARIGDVLVVKKDRNYFSCRLVGITSQIIIGKSIVPYQTAREILGYLDEASGVYVRSTSDIVKDKLYQYDYVGKVTVKHQLVSSFLKVMKEIMLIVYLATGISILMAMMFVFTSVVLSITEQGGEYAILKSIGYAKNALAKIILSEALAQGVLACTLSIPVAIGISGYLNYRLGQAWFRVHNTYALPDFSIVIAAALVLIPFSAYPGMKQVFGLNISEVNRNRAIE
jgi:putative ABC transport system permease protein